MAEEIYGSILEDSEMAIENRASEEHSDTFNDESQSADTSSVGSGCTCKSQCTRKLKTSANGKITGCPCKGCNLKCGRNCSCGTTNKPCKNKDGAVPGGQNTENREIAPIEELTVEQMLDRLDYQTLLTVSKKGFMSSALQLKDLIATVESDPVEPPIASHPVPPFCVCRHCHPMPTDKEQVCCKERRHCRSRTGQFQSICVDSDNLSTAIRILADTYVFTPTYDNRAMWHAAYRQHVMWQHGHLGKGHRRVIPSCCVWKVRKHYPSPNGVYTFYKDH